MDKKEIKAQAEAYCANPRNYRKSEEGQAELAALVAPVQAKVRELLEANRGFRRVNGVLEFNKEALTSQIVRLKEKRADIEAKLPTLDARIADLESDLAERFGGNNE